MVIDPFEVELLREKTNVATTEIEYYGTNLVTKLYDKSGGLSQTFAADRSEHYPDSKETTFSNPRINTRDQDGEDWLITAQQAVLVTDHDRVTLTDNVTISPSESPDNELQVTTSSLNYDHGQGIATTESVVTIVQPGIQVTATGMELNIQTQRLLLKAQVFTRYAQP